MFYIYKIVRLDIDKRVYIGMTKNPKKRFVGHYSEKSTSKNSLYIHAHGGKNNFKLIRTIFKVYFVPEGLYSYYYL